ncbi:MAG: hypothetical protein RLZZ262_2295 [Bacteroidota bacterium]|jgi:hypothetical protein
MRVIFFLFVMLGVSHFNASAQVVTLVVEQVENAGRVPGKTYRLYAVTTNTTDKVLVVYGDSITPLYIRSSKPFFQASTGGPTAQGSNRKMRAESDSLRHDSWITIGGEDNYDCKINSLNMDFVEFENGKSIEVPKDGAWFTIPTDRQAEAGEDKKVLLGQFTTRGTLEGQLNIMTKDAAGKSYRQSGLKFSTVKK